MAEPRLGATPRGGPPPLSPQGRGRTLPLPGPHRKCSQLCGRCSATRPHGSSHRRSVNNRDSQQCPWDVVGPARFRISEPQRTSVSPPEHWEPRPGLASQVHPEAAGTALDQDLGPGPVLGPRAGPGSASVTAVCPGRLENTVNTISVFGGGGGGRGVRPPPRGWRRTCSLGAGGKRQEAAPSDRGERG